MKTTKLDYYNGEDHHDGFRISASGISRFFTSTSSWFRENLLGESGFTGSTASVLGTVVHYNLECFIKGTTPDIHEIDTYINNQATIVDDLRVDYILMQYPIMTQVAIEFLQTINLSTAVSEEFMHQELLPGIHVGGSCDLYTDSCVYDYKTYSAKTPPKSMQYAHKLQLLTYAAIKIAQGVPIKYISTINISTYIDGGISEKTQRPLKSYPSDVTVLTEPITQDDLDMINNIHQLIAESVATFRDRPELRHLLAQDLRLKGCRCDLQKPDEEEI